MIFHYSFAFPEHTHFEAGSGSEHFFFFWHVLERDLAIFGFFIALGRKVHSPFYLQMVVML